MASNVDEYGTQINEPFIEPPQLTRQLMEIGQDLAWTITCWQEWSYRKVDTIELLPGTRGRRHVSVDCAPPLIAIPSSLGGSEFPAAGSIAVPLVFMKKDAMRSFDARDESNRALPVLGRTTNSTLSSAALYIIITLALNETEILEYKDDIWKRVWRITILPEESAQDELKQLINSYKPSDLVLRMIQDFVSCFLLILVLPEEQAGIRQILKYSYHWDVIPSVNIYNRLVAGFGQQSLRIPVEIGALDTAYSYHLECRVPPGLVATEIVLPKDRSGKPPKSEKLTSVAHINGNYDVACAERNQPAELWLALDSHELLPRLFLSCLAVAAISLAMLVFPTVLARIAYQADAAVALLLFFPAYVISSFAKSDENTIVSAVLLPLRVLAIMLVIWLFIAGVFIVYDPAWWATVCWFKIGYVLSAIAIVVSGRGLDKQRRLVERILRSR